jgi:hypothetical protein
MVEITQLFLFIFPAALLIYGVVRMRSGAAEYLLVQKIKNTPTSKVSSAAMGLVELSGKALGSATSEAPLSGKECVFWKVYARQHDPYHKDSKVIASVSSVMPLRIDDGTGSVAIDAKEADIDISAGPTHTSFLYSASPENVKSGADEPILRASKQTGESVRDSIENVVSGNAITRAETHSIPNRRVSAFLASNPSFIAAMEKHSRRNISLLEYSIENGTAVYALGTLSQSKSIPIIGKDRQNGILIISDEAEPQLVADLKSASYLSMALGVLALTLFAVASYLAMGFLIGA